MARRRRHIVIAVAISILLARSATGDVTMHMRTPSHVVTAGGSTLDLPPGYFLDEPTHDKLDKGVKDLQDARTSLTAENESLRTTLHSWQPGRYTLAIVALTALATGVYLGAKL